MIGYGGGSRDFSGNNGIDKVVMSSGVFTVS
jgi:hypothetical protein